MDFEEVPLLDLLVFLAGGLEGPSPEAASVGTPSPETPSVGAGCFGVATFLGFGHGSRDRGAIRR